MLIWRGADLSIEREAIDKRLSIIDTFEYMGSIDTSYGKLENYFGIPDIIESYSKTGWLVKKIENNEEVLILNSEGNYKECVTWKIYGTFLTKITVDELEKITDSFFYDWML